MLTVRLAGPRRDAATLALGVEAAGRAAGRNDREAAFSEADSGTLAEVPGLPEPVRAEAVALLEQAEHRGSAGTVQSLPRPLSRPRRVLLAGIGAGDEAGWRAAGAGLYRAAQRDSALTVALPAGSGAEQVRGLAEGLLLAAYRYRLGGVKPDSAPTLRQVTVAVENPGRYEEALATARTVAEYTYLARDLVNTPSMEKTPAWFADRVGRAAAGVPNLRLTVRDPQALAAEGFGGILAVGGGSRRGPRLVELAWRPRGATRHVVLVGKGITFDSGGISIKPVDGMRLMRKDMGGAAAVVAATLCAARLKLPVRVTALAPLAENMVSGKAWRPGDLVRHYGGKTTEALNTDAEGRVVLADALAYAARRLAPDALVDLATLTGANMVALGRRTAALYSDSDALSGELAEAAAAAGENVWRMPLADDYVGDFASDVADVANIAGTPGAGSIIAALYLREFTGTARDRWAHFDMSAPSWVESADGELAKGATGWGVRTLVRWLATTS